MMNEDSFNKEIRIVNSKIKRRFNEQQDIVRCKLCGCDIKRKNNGFHRSHGIPRFILENIKEPVSENMKVAAPNAIFSMNPLDKEPYVGANNAGIFYLICSDCDQNYFQVYESENKLIQEINSQVLDSIALKIALKEYFDSFYKFQVGKIEFDSMTKNEIIESMLKVQSQLNKSVVKLDLRDFESDIQYSLRSYKKLYDSNYIIYSSIVDYTVPIAAQVSIPISRNIDYSNLQNVTSTNPHRIESLNLVIFPMKEQSLLLLFTRRNNRKMRKYIKQFNRLSRDMQQSELFYLAIRYKSTNIYFSPLVVSMLKENEVIRKIMAIGDSVLSFGPFKISEADSEELTTRHEIPNLLSEEYSVQKLKL